MTKLNTYLIPKENIPKVEEVRYLDQNYQPQGYEEFMKTYEPNELVEVISEAEYQDRLLRGPQYGPGNEQSQEVVKKVGSIALATSYFTPLGAVTAPMTAVAIGTGGAVWAVGKASDDGELKKAGGFITGMAFDAAVDGLSAGTLSASAPAIAKLTKGVCKSISEIGDMKDKIAALERRGVYIPMELTPQQRAQFVTHILKYGL